LRGGHLLQQQLLLHSFVAPTQNKRGQAFLGCPAQQSVVFPWDIVLRAGPFMEDFYLNGQRSLGFMREYLQWGECFQVQWKKPWVLDCFHIQIKKPAMPNVIVPLFTSAIN
jgi:hypothetical protein